MGETVGEGVGVTSTWAVVVVLGLGEGLDDEFVLNWHPDSRTNVASVKKNNCFFIKITPFLHNIRLNAEYASIYANKKPEILDFEIKFQ